MLVGWVVAKMMAPYWDGESLMLCPICWCGGSRNSLKFVEFGLVETGLASKMVALVEMLDVLVCHTSGNMAVSREPG